jgi:multiple sugar transport system permease protein
MTTDRAVTTKDPVGANLVPSKPNTANTLIYIREFLVEAATHLTLAVAATVAFGAFLWMVLASFKPSSEIIQMPPTFLPAAPTLESYVIVLTEQAFARYFLNSAVVAVPTVLLILFTSSLAGFVFAKYDFLGKETCFVIILSTLMVPPAVTLLPLFRLVGTLGWADTYVALILPVCVSAFGIFLMRQFMEGIPTELLDAGRIDGASEWWIYLHIILPLTTSALSALAIFTFLANWDSYLWPLVITYDETMRTLPVGLAHLLGWASRPRYDLFLTGAVITVVPVVIFYAIFQRRFVHGITMTGLKL